MTRTERAARLKSMLTRIGADKLGLREPSTRDDGIAALERLRTFDGLESLEDAQDTSTAAIQKLEQDREDQLTPIEMDALEAIVLPRERPVVFVKDGTYDSIGQPWTHLNEAAVRARLDPLLPSIGRVEVPQLPWVPYGGTAFVVGSDLLMTNRHVAKLFCEGRGVTRLTYRSGDAAVDFKREVNTRPSDRTLLFHVVRVEMVHPYWDMAILRVQGLPARITPLKLSVGEPESLLGEDIVAIGYPARDDRNDLDVQDRIFDRQFNVKRLQPGKLRVRERIRSFEQVVDAVTHDSSTLGGNSGSALVHVHTGQVVGLHFAGLYLKANYAVPAYELARDARVVQTGVNFTGSVPPTDAWDAAWRDAGEALALPAPVPQVVAPAPAITAPAGTAATMTIPLQVAVTVGAPQTGATPAGAMPAGLGPTVVEAPRFQVPVVHDGLEHREGYRPDFIEGVDVPLPPRTALARQVTAKLEDGSDELKYHKFSIVMHRGRRLALLTAANVDWRDTVRRIGGRKPTREQLTGIPDGVQEEWITDWRIAEHHQLPDIFFTRDRQSFDKGHVVRRDDVAWGDSFDDMQMSNGDTFHTTNCTPQTAAFNQSGKGEDNWGDLENLVQKETKAQKALVFGGPVLAPTDPFFYGMTSGGPLRVRIPRRFWKIVVVEGGGGPEAYGFVLKHDLSDVQMRVEEFAVPARWVRFMSPVADIEALMRGLVSLAALKPFDQFGSGQGVRMREHLESSQDNR